MIILTIYWYTVYSHIIYVSGSSDFKCAHCVAFRLNPAETIHQDLIGSRRIPKASCEDCGRIDPNRRCWMISFRSPPWNIAATRVLCVESGETSQAWRCFLGASRLLGALDTCRVHHCPRGLRVCRISECDIKRYQYQYRSTTLNRFQSIDIFSIISSLEQIHFDNGTTLSMESSVGQRRFWDSAPGKAFLWWSPVQVPFPDTGSSTAWNRWKCWKPGSPSRESYCTLQSFELNVSSSKMFYKMKKSSKWIWNAIHTLACTWVVYIILTVLFDIIINACIVQAYVI